MVGALGQPLLFWSIFGLGLGGAFRVPGAEGLDYLEYFYPGVLVMIVLFTSIFSTMSVIEDRHAGFLQLALVAPASRLALVLGKTLGGTAIALVQAAVFLCFAKLAGFDPARVAWLSLAAVLIAGAVGLTALGLALAWLLDSVQGYHAVMSLLLIPMWVLSGAMFPAAHSAPVLGSLMRWNPMTYIVCATRRALAGGEVPDALAIATPAVELVVVVAFAVIALGACVAVCSRRR